MSIFSERLSRRVNELEIPWCELSLRTGISPSRISHYKNGIYTPKMDALHSLAIALDVTPDWLIGATDALDRYPHKHALRSDEIFDRYLLCAYHSADENVQKAICILLNVEELERGS